MDMSEVHALDRACYNRTLTFKPRNNQLPRKMGYSDIGDLEGTPLLVLIGLGGTRLVVALFEDIAIKYKLRLITPERPGYGLSDKLASLEVNEMAEWGGNPEKAKEEAKEENLEDELKLYIENPDEYWGRKKKHDIGHHKFELNQAIEKRQDGQLIDGCVTDILVSLEKGPPWDVEYAKCPYPVIVYYGEKDGLVPEKSIEWMQKTMKDCTVKWIPNSDHAMVMKCMLMETIFMDYTRTPVDTSTTASVCKYYLKGNCKFGNKCALLHVSLVGPKTTNRQFNESSTRLEPKIPQQVSLSSRTVHQPDASTSARSADAQASASLHSQEGVESGPVSQAIATPDLPTTTIHPLQNGNSLSTRESHPFERKQSYESPWDIVGQKSRTLSSASSSSTEDSASRHRSFKDIFPTSTTAKSPTQNSFGAGALLGSLENYARFNTLNNHAAIANDIADGDDDGEIPAEAGGMNFDALLEDDVELDDAFLPSSLNDILTSTAQRSVSEPLEDLQSPIPQSKFPPTGHDTSMPNNSSTEDDQSPEPQNVLGTFGRLSLVNSSKLSEPPASRFQVSAYASQRLNKAYEAQKNAVAQKNALNTAYASEDDPSFYMDQVGENMHTQENHRSTFRPLLYRIPLSEDLESADIGPSRHSYSTMTKVGIQQSEDEVAHEKYIEKMSKEPLCIYAKAGNCRFGDYCQNLHGLPCPSCTKLVLHPFRSAEEHEEHIKECNERMAKLSSINQAEIECGICMEKVLSKPDPRFGLLNCDHPFCLQCIRSWRANHTLDNIVVRSCPVCRIVTHFATPSTVWITDKEEKAKVIEEYKAKLGTIQCKHYANGEGQCPFGTSCFYAHINKDGTRQDVKLRTVVGDDEIRVLSTISKKQAEEDGMIALLGDVQVGRVFNHVLSPTRNTSDAGITNERFRALFPNLSTDVFGTTRPLLQDCSPVIANLECSVGDGPLNDAYVHVANAKNMNALRGVVDICCLANNHSLDADTRGLKATLTALYGNGIKWTGVGKDDNQARQPAFFLTPDGLRMLVFAYADHLAEWAARPGQPGINYFDVDHFKMEEGGNPNRHQVESIHAIKANVDKWRTKFRPDVIIFSMHWGKNFQWHSSETFEAFARAVVSICEIDVFFGHSTHHIQGIEVFEGRPIIYGAGDALSDYDLYQTILNERGSGEHEFDYKPFIEYRSHLGFIYVLHHDKTDGGVRLSKLECVPFSTRLGQMYRLDEAEESCEWLYAKMQSLGARYGTRFERCKNTLQVCL
ncbi:hypothetical protein BZG36_02074 [Bifiguratus adelaidae]|uniref:RING-type E3 ubiquitin transferase n=1 Tax=Bifiguratus adelaidae TaxID=1938954 RepID=A0A261Y3A7_9FUNG|nr:hypothetical protein BZG36_02074 [Bifiguratus adelaidae]